jgi:hypothetical protein
VRAFALAMLAACGDNRIVPDAAIDAPDAYTPRVDLVLAGDQMKDTILVMNEMFDAAACEVVEQCVGAPGPRRLLRFDTVTANLGDADLVLGRPPPAGASDDTFVWSPCHGHHHVPGFATYELRDATGARVTGRKQSFCLHDVQAIRPESSSQGYHCMNQGLSAGWADVYARTLSCQWLDITDLAGGTYTLRVEVNASRALDEKDVTNNAWSIDVSF